MVVLIPFLFSETILNTFESILKWVAESEEGLSNSELWFISRTRQVICFKTPTVKDERTGPLQP